MSIWSSLDELVGTVASNAGKLVDSAVDSKIAQTRDEDVVRAANATAVSSTSRVPFGDPNGMQRWLFIGGGLLLVGGIAYLALRRRS